MGVPVSATLSGTGVRALDMLDQSYCKKGHWRAERLGFVSWEGDERTFKEGVLTTPAESTKHFATAGKRVELTAADVGELKPEIIAACVYVWPTEP